MKLWMKAKVKSSGQVVLITSHSLDLTSKEETVIVKWLEDNQPMMFTYDVSELDFLE